MTFSFRHPLHSQSVWLGTLLMKIVLNWTERLWINFLRRTNWQTTNEREPILLKQELTDHGSEATRVEMPETSQEVQVWKQQLEWWFSVFDEPTERNMIEIWHTHTHTPYSKSSSGLITFLLVPHKSSCTEPLSQAEIHLLLIRHHATRLQLTIRPHQQPATTTRPASVSRRGLL